MNYVAIYDRLMRRAHDRNISVFVEIHHIVPRCLGGTNDPDNLVSLTPEEHYVAHQLLVRMFPGNGKLIWAAIAMTNGGRSSQRSNNKLYGWLKREFSSNQTGRRLTPETRRKIGESSRKRNQGHNHPMYGKSHSEETREKIRKGNIGKPGVNLGKSPSPETKKKISLALKKVYASRPPCFLGQKHSQATREKMRAGWRRRLETLQEAADAAAL